MKLIIRGIQIISCLVGITLLGVIAFLIWTSANFYAPPLRTEIKIQGNFDKEFSDSQELTLISWNIGYCGLGKDMDFFYDGGTRVMCELDTYQKNLNGIFNFLFSNSEVDYFLIQEVDVDSKRSFNTRQDELLAKALRTFNRLYATNYQVGFVPVPLTSPMGKVNAGLMTFTRYHLKEAYRQGFEVNYEWPKNLFMLKRCLMVTRKQLNNGKDLVVINMHNSAFDEDGRLRDGELKVLKTILLDEYSKGNYIIAGGDWNQNPPGFQKRNYPSGDIAEVIHPAFPESFMPKTWKYLFDTACPSNRFLDISYTKGRTKTTTIDFFLISPNIEAQMVKTLPLGFEFSDHNPVMVKVKLTEDPVNLQLVRDSLEIKLLKDSIQNLVHKKPGRKPVGK